MILLFIYNPFGRRLSRRGESFALWSCGLDALEWHRGGVRGHNMKDYAERFYKSRKWQKVRQYVWTRDKGLCQNCLKNGLIKGGDTVHHIIEINPENITNEEISLNPDNLVTLCRDCHAAMHRKQKRWTVDELGRVSSTESPLMS